MISTIIDSNGLPIYTGNEENDKFTTLLAKAGNSRVDTIPTVKPAKWDGTKWISYERPNAYIDKRRSEYLDIGEQLDMLWHAMDTGVLPKVDSFYDINKSIKDKFPKE